MGTYFTIKQPEFKHQMLVGSDNTVQISQSYVGRGQRLEENIEEECKTYTFQVCLRHFLGGEYTGQYYTVTTVRKQLSERHSLM